MISQNPECCGYSPAREPSCLAVEKMFAESPEFAGRARRTRTLEHTRNRGLRASGLGPKALFRTLFSAFQDGFHGTEGRQQFNYRLCKSPKKAASPKACTSKVKLSPKRPTHWKAPWQPEASPEAQGRNPVRVYSAW